MVVVTSLLLALSATVIGSARAHGGCTNYTVGDTWYRGYTPDAPLSDQEGKPWQVQRKWVTIDPIFSVDDKGLACNNPGTRAFAYMPIEAGQNITAVYYYWLHPYGPMSVWLTPCGETCDTVDVNEAEWFKIWESGLLSGPVATGQWYQREFQTWDGTPDLWSVTIPESLKPGLYIVRHEILSIHIADKPQFYPECANLNVTGRGGFLPPAEYMKKFPGAYSADDPSIKIDLYTDEAANTYNYTIPGGRVWPGFSLVNKYCLGC